MLQVPKECLSSDYADEVAPVGTAAAAILASYETRPLVVCNRMHTYSGEEQMRAYWLGGEMVIPL